MKKSILEIYHFFILLLFSLLLSYLVVSFVNNFKDEVKEKISNHIDKLNEEKKFALLLNFETFSYLNYFCLGKIDKEDLADFFNNIKGNFLIKVSCLNRDLNFYYSNLASEENSKCHFIYTSLYKVKVCII